MLLCAVKSFFGESAALVLGLVAGVIGSVIHRVLLADVMWTWACKSLKSWRATLLLTACLVCIR